ncbi:neutral zinc metallopeptidase [Saccharomonospora sp. NPDC006951]
MDGNIDSEPTRNSPFAILGVLAVVLGVVAVVALAGRSTRPVVEGVAQPAPDALVDAPQSPAASAPRRSAEAVPSAPSEPHAAAETAILTHGLAVSPVTCELAEFGPSEQALTAFYQSALTCLGDTWRPVLLAAGGDFADPALDIGSDSASACGPMPDEQEATAFYCGLDETIHMPRQRLFDHVGPYDAAHLAVLAHEYGHHVQYVGGILDAVNEELIGAEEGGDEELGLNRRVELQANCLAGMALASFADRGSVSEELAQAAIDDFRNYLDSDTHGSMENQAYWADVGYAAVEVAECDTFTAPASAVR